MTVTPADPVDIRASYLRFPGWTQHFWTWMTGKALPHQTPLVRHTWWSYLALTLLVFFASLAASSTALALRGPGWPVVLMAGWVGTLAAARTMILVIAHQCIHRRFSGSARVDACVGELVTLLNVYQDARTFKTEHFDGHHHARVFATMDDPPVQSLLKLGFRPGLSRHQLWCRAAVVFVSPLFYGSALKDRFHANLTCGTWRRAVFMLWAGFWLSVPFWVPNGGQVLLLAFALPVLVLSQLSALLDRLGEHAWLTPPDPRHGRRFRTATASWARFCGSPVPRRSSSMAQAACEWLVWWGATLLYHLPARLLVVVGDLPNHDFHHRFPASREWMVAAYARQHDIDTSAPGAPAYVEVWGLLQAIDRMFLGLSLMPAAEGGVHACLDH